MHNLSMFPPGSLFLSWMLCPELMVFFYVLNILVGIYIPVIISKVVERTPYRWLHLALGLKKKTVERVS